MLPRSATRRIGLVPSRLASGWRRSAFGWLDQQIRSRLAPRRKPIDVVCVLDGQESLWDTKAIFQPDPPTVEILDLWHVTARLWKAAHLFHPTDLPAAEACVREPTLRILPGQVKSVIHSLRSRATRRQLAAASRKSLAVICNYFAKNRARMRYDEYLRQGYPIASGVIEGACRHVVKDRLERTGMSWTRGGAQALLHLRAIATSDQWHEYLTYRVQHEVQRLYPYRHQLPPLEIPIAAGNTNPQGIADPPVPSSHLSAAQLPASGQAAGDAALLAWIDEWAAQTPSERRKRM